MSSSSAQLGTAINGGCEEGRPEFFRIGLPDSNCCEYVGFVAPSGVGRVQTVGAELLHVNDGAVPVGQFHRSFIVATYSLSHAR